MESLDPDNLKLTDFMDLPTLQEIQDNFAAVANVRATITDADGNVLTQPQPTKDFLRRQRAIAAAEEDQMARRRRAPNTSPRSSSTTSGWARSACRRPAPRRPGRRQSSPSWRRSSARPQADQVAGDAARPGPERQAAGAIQFLFLLANAIARLCYQEFQLRQRINELTAVYNVTMMLADARDLQQVLQRTVQVVCELMETKAGSLRLIDREQRRAGHQGRSTTCRDEYLNKGPIRLSKAEIDQIALSTEGFEYVRDMADRPAHAVPAGSRCARASFRCFRSGMRYKGKPVGVLRVYTEHGAGVQPS